MKWKLFSIGLLICLFFLDIHSLDAQNQSVFEGKKFLNTYREERPLPRYTFAIQPLHLANGGWRVDFERQLKSHRKWLQLGLTGFYRSRYDGVNEGWENFNSDFSPLVKFKGVGVDGAYKQFFHRSLFYWSAGVGYSHHRVTYSEMDFVPLKENGLTFYEYKKVEKTQYFHKILPTVCVGLQTTLESVVFIDVYFGMGYAYAFYDKDKKSYNDVITGYGYRGFRPVGGVRIGAPFGKKQ